VTDPLDDQSFDITVTTTATRHTLTRLSYGPYAWFALLICGLPALLFVTITPGRRMRRRLTSWFARLYFRVIGSPVGVEGAANMPAGACIVIANHASYLDGIILTAALPPNFTFVIKREMANFPFAGFFLRRIGSEFVDRASDAHKKRTARRLFKAARSGDALAFFPEGTFRPEPGLRQFKPGAFRAAWQGKVPLVPIAIYGARAKLPAEVWLPAPGPLMISIGKSISPEDHDSARTMLQATRASLLARLSEPDLDGESDIMDDSAQPGADP